MRVLVHDYAGHAFTAQLARALALDGNDVLYASFREFESPKGRVERAIGDPPGFRARQLSLNRPFDKENLARRWLQQRDYAQAVTALLRQERPDVVLSSAPIEIQETLARNCSRMGLRFVFWMQDIHAEAIERILAQKNRVVGWLAGRYYRRKEALILRSSDAVVVIAEAFRNVLGGPRWGLDVSAMKVIENWANIADIPPLPRENDWSLANMRGGRQRIVYSGTLARKHNPDLLLELARNVDADVYLFSAGPGADHVRRIAAAEGLDNMIVRPWVSVEELPAMLAGADILFAVIESDAGVFSVPSKVLSYLAAGRPILASIPKGNLAAVTLEREAAGLVASPDNTGELIGHARTLLGDGGLRAIMGRAARAYAERAFEIDAISRRFETVLRNAMIRSDAVALETRGQLPLAAHLPSARERP